MLPRLLVCLLFAVAGFDLSHAQDIDPTSNPSVQPYTNTPVSGYQLAWSDEFNSNAVDTAKWNFRTGVRLWSTQLPANNSVSNGLYYLHVKKETVGATDYTAGGIISKKAVRYGYYETRMRVPPGRGWHTSFWMMFNGTPTNNIHTELDVLENDSVNLFKYGVNTHRHQPTPHVTYGSKTINTPSLNASFHVLGSEFTPAQIKYFFDGALVQTVDATLFTHNDLNIWLTSVAAALGGTTNVDDTQLPNAAEFDYARFFTSIATNTNSVTSSISIVTPGATAVTLADTNTTLRVAALATSSDSNYIPTVVWSKVSGPGGVTFGNATNADTTANFSTPGTCVLQCQAVVLNSTNVAQVTVAVAALLTLALREGLNGYAHVATFLRGDSTNWNSGARDQFLVGRNNSKGLRPIFSFDLGGIETNASIQSVTLDLWTDATAGIGSVGPLELRPLLASPVEGTGDSGSSSSVGAGTGVTWFTRTGGTNGGDLWLNPGGDFATNVLATLAGYDATIANQQRSIVSTPDLVAAAQAAVSTEEPLNLLLISPTTEVLTSNVLSRFSSDDSLNTEQRPKLTLTFLGNLAPTISPGNAFVARTNVPARLGGVVANTDGSAWSKVGGPGTVTFADATIPGTMATFTAAGNYSLRLTASNALAQVSRDLAVTVVSSPPQLGSLLLASNWFQFQVSGATGVTYTVQASTNLATWTDLSTTNPAALPFTWQDTGATNFPLRFYRVLLGP